jgi:hypothetical protein
VGGRWTTLARMVRIILFSARKQVDKAAVQGAPDACGMPRGHCSHTTHRDRAGNTYRACAAKKIQRDPRCNAKGGDEDASGDLGAQGRLS